jgi:catechol 2,3-dioxygenase-like lactoylglutathione lyase family enzyme
MDWKLQVVVVPVSDVDRAKEFYADRLGFALDTDHRAGEHFRVVQVTPPGSGCSIVFGTGMGNGTPGSLKGTQFVVDDIRAAAEHLDRAGIGNSGIQHFEDGAMRPGPHPDDREFGSFVFFDDPDGNTWAVQQGKRTAG